MSERSKLLQVYIHKEMPEDQKKQWLDEHKIKSSFGRAKQPKFDGDFQMYKYKNQKKNSTKPTHQVWLVPETIYGVYELQDVKFKQQRQKKPSEIPVAVDQQKSE